MRFALIIGIGGTGGMLPHEMAHFLDTDDGIEIFVLDTEESLTVPDPDPSMPLLSVTLSKMDESAYDPSTRFETLIKDTETNLEIHVPYYKDYIISLPPRSRCDFSSHMILIWGESSDNTVITGPILLSELIVPKLWSHMGHPEFRAKPQMDQPDYVSVIFPVTQGNEERFLSFPHWGLRYNSTATHLGGKTGTAQKSKLHGSQRLAVVGITGTNGKTTATCLAKSINTNPESLDLQHMFSQMLQRRTDSVVTEASSHALASKRVIGVDFDVAVLTNLHQEHLDFHKAPSTYIDQILEGVENKEKAEIIIDREEETRKALRLVEKGDCSVLAAKGHEDSRQFYGECLLQKLKDVGREYLMNKATSIFRRTVGHEDGPSPIQSEARYTNNLHMQAR
jgi:hypothetical protein